MKLVDEEPVSRGPNTRTPIDALIDEMVKASLVLGKSALIQRGVDYTCTDTSMTRTCYRQARKRELRVSVNNQGHGTLLVRFYKKEG